MTDFAKLTACGECCENCTKKQTGFCPGCIEADGHVPEWAESGQCRIHACVTRHHIPFCGLCECFPCRELPMLVPLNPEIVHHMAALRDEYLASLKTAGGNRE